jgi:multiple sugar transport system substrate-binding protein
MAQDIDRAPALKNGRNGLMKATFSRRAFLRASALAGGGIVAGGLAPRLAQAQAATQIRFGGFVQSQAGLEHQIACLKAYSAKKPSVTIVPEFTNFNAFTDKLATEAAGGNPPDMFDVNVDLLAEYARRGVIGPLDQYVPNPLDISDYLKGTINGASFDGKLYAIPNDAVTPAGTVNTAVLKEIGVTMTAQMWTWVYRASWAVDVSKEKGRRFW